MRSSVDAIEYQNRSIDAGLAQLDPFLGLGNPEAIDPVCLEPPGDRNHPMPVRVGFDDGQDLFARRRGANHF